MKIKNIEELNIAVVGLGYVGLPLAIAFAENRTVLGFDIDPSRILELEQKYDRTSEFTSEQLEKVNTIKFSNQSADLLKCNCYIISVPTPVDSRNQPDFSLIKTASRLVGGNLKRGDFVIFESTVFPGMTEDICSKILSDTSGLDCSNKNSQENINVFHLGYSPERINPGDKKHTLKDIVKITSGSTPEASLIIDQLYKSIITAGTLPVESIRVAEAAKVIENIQRDVNIALINEFSIILNHLGLDTKAVLEAARTKWNFLPFEPGLVGGHCIGVDPYYLTYKARQVGYEPQLILAGRSINDNMSSYVVERVFHEMKNKNIKVSRSKILVLGITFKEDCSDIRNSKILDILSQLKDEGCQVDAYDPMVANIGKDEPFSDFLISKPLKGYYDVVILAVKHKIFIENDIIELKRFGKKVHVFADLKSVFKLSDSDIRL